MSKFVSLYLNKHYNKNLSKFQEFLYQLLKNISRMESLRLDYLHLVVGLSFYTIHQFLRYPL